MTNKFSTRYLDQEMATNAELQAVEDKFDTMFNDTKEPTGHLDRTQSVMTFNDSTRTLSISPLSETFTVYVKGVKLEISSTLTKQIPNTSGNYFFYIGADGLLDYYYSFNPLVLTDVAYTAFVHWNATLGQAVAFGEERHGTVMDGVTHSYLHTTRGTQLVSGAAITYTLGSGLAIEDAQIALSNMQIKDEDITANIAHASSPSSQFQQVLNPIAYLPVHYRDGSEWVKATANSYPMLVGTNRSKYNLFNGTTWSLVESSANDKVLVSYIFATTNISEPVIALLGQDQYDTLEDAKTLAAWDQITFGDLPAQEMKLLYIVFYQTNSSYANESKSKIIYVSDVRFSIDRQVSATVFNGAHGNLSGLENDDHPQYKQRSFHTGTQLASTISDFETAVQAVNIDAAKIDGGAVSNTEFSYLNGVTSAIQTQLDGKQPTGNYITALTGDATASGPGSATLTLANSGVTAGTYNQVTVDAKGRATSGAVKRYTASLSAPVASTTAAFAATNLSVTLPIGLYRFKFIGLFQTAATATGAGFRVGAGTAVISTVYGKFFIAQAANGTGSNYQVDQLAANTNVTSTAALTANSNVVATGDGVVRVTTAGTVRLEFRTEVAGSAATLQTDSIIEFEALN